MYWNLKLTAYDTTNNNEIIFSGEAKHESKDLLNKDIMKSFIKVTKNKLIEKYRFTIMKEDSIIRIKAEWSKWTDDDEYIEDDYHWENYYYKFNKKQELRQFIRKTI